MRTLKFIVDGQTIKPNPNCDFSNLVPGTKGYLRAEFSFSSDWDGTARVVGFFSPTGVEYPPRILEDGKSCIIPDEATRYTKFKIQVLGRGENFTIKTGRYEICQNGE